MADKDSMSVEDILAKCRQIDSGQGSAASGKPAAGKPAEPAASEPSASAPALQPAAPSPPPTAAGGKSAKEMSVADILAAARGQTAAPAAPAASEPAAPAASEPAAPAPAASKPAAPAKKPGEMSVADILAAARGKAPAAPAAEAPKPAPTPKAKPAAAAPKEAPKKAPAGPQVAAAIDTQSILAAARKGDKRGPITKEEAKAKTAVAEKAAKPAKPKIEVPPMPQKPAYATRPAPAAVAPAGPTRRSFLTTAMGVFFGSSLAVGFTTLTLTNLLWLLGLARFMFPNILTEPPTKFKVGFPGDYAPGQVETKYIPQFGVWIVRYQYEGQAMIYALKAVCTHLGCTPNWLDAEQKFKCPCHGSGFYKDGINFEGPAPRPLERYAIRVADDGQLEVDKSQTFNEELGQWSNSSSFVLV